MKTRKPITIDDVAREYLRAKSASLQEQLEVSVFVERIKREMREQQATDAADGVTDFQRGWRIK